MYLTICESIDSSGDGTCVNANKRIVGVVTPRNHRSRYEISRGREEKKPAKEPVESSIYGSDSFLPAAHAVMFDLCNFRT